MGSRAYIALPVGDELRFVVAIPDFELSTATARAVLPAEVPRADAVFNSSRTALFVYAMHSKRYELLANAMEDRLHPALSGATRAGHGRGDYGRTPGAGVRGRPQRCRPDARGR